MKIIADEEGIATLRTMMSNLESSICNISLAVQQLESRFEENRELMGPHLDEIRTIVDNTNNITRDANNSASKLIEKLIEIEAAIREFISLSLLNISDSQFPDDVQSFKKDLQGMRSTLDLGEGESDVQQLSGLHKDVQSKEEKGYESHHIPSAAVLVEFGINKDLWPTIALLKEDHAKTDSYRGKQRSKYKPFLPDVPVSDTYKDESITMVDSPGVFFQLVRNEILNIKKCCGDRYDGAIKKFFDELEAYIEKNGIPKRKR